MSPFFPFILVTHIVLAIGLLLPSIFLPFALRSRRDPGDSSNRLVRFLLWMQANGTVAIGIGLAVSGAALVMLIGSELLAQPWIIVALAIYAANLGLAFFVQRPNLLRLVGIRSSSDDAVWGEWAKRQRYLSYAMAALVGTIGFLMSTKPVLW